MAWSQAHPGAYWTVLLNYILTIFDLVFAMVDQLTQPFRCRP